MTDLRKAAKQALEALEPYADIKPRDWKTDREKLWRAYDDLRAALAQPDVPKGWVLVPVEPTPEMLAVARERGGHYGYDYEIKAEWRAMLAAAPKGGA